MKAAFLGAFKHMVHSCSGLSIVDQVCVSTDTFSTSGLPAYVPLDTTYAFLWLIGIWIFGTMGLEESRFRCVSAPDDGFINVSRCVLENYRDGFYSFYTYECLPSICLSWLFLELEEDTTTFELLFCKKGGTLKPLSSKRSSSSFGCIAIYDEFNLDRTLISYFYLSYSCLLYTSPSPRD